MSPEFLKSVDALPLAEDARAAYKDIFIRIAQGDLDGAHRMTASHEPH